MSAENLSLIDHLMRSLKDGGTEGIVEFLSKDVIYHNVPWPPVTGHHGVKKTLAPFIDGNEGGLESITIHHTAARGQTVINARDEVWIHRDVKVVLPVAGVFQIKAAKITQWTDYFDSRTLKPILDSINSI